MMNRKGDGYEGFKKEYGFDFGTVRPMQNRSSLRRIKHREVRRCIRLFYRWSNCRV